MSPAHCLERGGAEAVPACGAGDLLPVARMRALLLRRAADWAGRLAAAETVPLERARGRILAEPVAAPRDLPPWDVAAMDGYAVSWEELRRGGGRLAVRGRAAAGDAPGRLASGTAMRVFTGAPLPEGADTVLPQESCRIEGAGANGWLAAPVPEAPGGHVRHRGEELAAGTVALRPGQRLDPPRLGLLAALGRREVCVRRRLRVALLVTGEELLPGRPGGIGDANGPMLEALLEGMGLAVRRAPPVGDGLRETWAALREAAREAEVLLTTGGVSVGETDHVRRAVERLGRVEAWGVAMKPGKPFAFGEAAGRPWLGLPGNPSGALVAWLVLAAPFLERLQGLTEPPPPAPRLPAAFGRPPARRREFLRVRLAPGPDGTALEPAGPQGSGRLDTAAAAHGLAEVAEGREVRPGDLLPFLPFLWTQAAVAGEGRW